MFRTPKCSSSGRLVHAVLWYFFIHPYRQSGRCQSHQDTELTKIKVTVVIKLKWPNLDYTSCQLVGRLHVTFPVTTKSNIPWVEFVWRLRELAACSTFTCVPTQVLITSKCCTQYNTNIIKHFMYVCPCIIPTIGICKTHPPQQTRIRTHR